MTFKEFKEEIENWGKIYDYKTVVEVDCNYLYIEIMFEGNGYPDTICAVHKSERFVIDLDWIPYKNLSENEKKELFRRNNERLDG